MPRSGLSGSGAGLVADASLLLLRREKRRARKPLRGDGVGRAGVAWRDVRSEAATGFQGRGGGGGAVVDVVLSGREEVVEVLAMRLCERSAIGSPRNRGLAVRTRLLML